MSRVKRKPVFGFPTRPNTNWTVQPKKMDKEAWNFGFRKLRDCTIYLVKTKVLIGCAVTVQLMCVFVFAFAKMFSHEAAHMSLSIFH